MPTAAYLEEIQAPGPIPVIVVEIDLDRCLNDYASAVAPSTCTAADAGDGLRCCFTRGTCQDPENYRKGTFTHRFMSLLNPLPANFLEAWPNGVLPLVLGITDVAVDFEIEAGFTRPEKMTVTLADLGTTSSDRVTGEGVEFDDDKPLRNTSRLGYVSRRLVAASPNYINRPIRIYRGLVADGFLSSDLDEAWNGVVENVTWDNQGRWKVHAHDLLEGLETELPPKIDAELTADIGIATTTVPCTNAGKVTDQASIAGDVVVATTSSVTGRREYMRVTARDAGAGTLTVVRGQYGSTPQPHAAGQALDEALAFVSRDGLSGVHATDIVLDILDRARLPAAGVDAAQIQAQALWMGPQTLRRIVEKPEKANALVFEILGSLYVANLFGDEGNKLRMIVCNPGILEGDPVPIVDGGNIAENSVELNDNGHGRITQTTVLFAHRDGATGRQDTEYEAIEIAYNGETTPEEYFGDTREKLIKTKWLDASGRSMARITAVRHNILFAFAQERIAWEGPLRDAGVRVGSLVSVTTRELQTVTGEPRTLVARVVQKHWSGLGGFRWVAQALGFRPPAPDGASGRWALIAPDATPDWGSATEADRQYAFFGDASNELAGEAGYYTT